MRSLYVKFVAVTIGIMLLSGVIAFIHSNVYYQQKLKPVNDENNTKISKSISSFV